MAATVQHSAVGTASGATSVTSSSFTSAASGSMFLIMANGDPGFSQSASDNKGNTYTLVQTQTCPDPTSAGTGAGLSVFVCPNGVGGAGHTGTITFGGSTFPGLIFVEIADAGKTLSIDTGSLAHVASLNSSPTGPWTITSNTFNANSSLAICCCGDDMSGVVNVTASGWSTVIDQNDNNNFYGAHCLSKALSGTTSQSPSIVGSGSGSSTVGQALVIFGIISTSSAPSVTGNTVTGSVSGFGSGVGVAHGVTATSSTTAPGNVKGNISLALTGVSATGSPGTVVVAGAPATATAVTATGSVTTVKAGVQLSLSGNSASGSVSNVAAGIAAVASGNSASGTLGTMQVSADKPLTGTVSTCAVGTPIASIARPLSAVSSACTVTAAGANVSIALTGVSSTCTVGTLQAPGNQLSPVTCSGAVGSLGLTVSHALSGVSSTDTPGTVVATPQRALTGVQLTTSVGTVTFGNIVVGLTRVQAVCTVGNLAPPATPDFKNGELFFAQQMALPFGYIGTPGQQRNRGTIMYASGSWQVPVGASTVFVSASAGGGTPLGNAGDQQLQGTLPVSPGDVLTVTMNPNGEVYVNKGTTQLLFLRAGAAYGKIAWQSTWGQNSGLPGGFGSGVDAGIPFPPILVFYWT